MPTCVEGHTSGADDYCDLCGAPIASEGRPQASAGAEVKACPSCGMPFSGRFCEECGHDSTQPAPVVSTQPAAAVASVVWTAVVAADRAHYQRVVASEGPDTVAFPAFFPERRIILQNKTTLIGRANPTQGVEPEIDLGIHPADRGVSTQHAVLRLRDSSLTITDLGSTNGTSLNDGDGVLREGEEVPLKDGDRIHVGAWTTITVVQPH